MFPVICVDNFGKVKSVAWAENLACVTLFLFEK